MPVIAIPLQVMQKIRICFLTTSTTLYLKVVVNK